MISSLPPPDTALNQHSLAALEFWLHELGAVRNEIDLCSWEMVKPEWTAVLLIGKDNISIEWVKEGNSTYCSFPYGLSRHDVEITINSGP